MWFIALMAWPSPYFSIASSIFLLIVISNSPRRSIISWEILLGVNLSSEKVSTPAPSVAVWKVLIVLIVLEVSESLSCKGSGSSWRSSYRSGDPTVAKAILGSPWRQ